MNEELKIVIRAELAQFKQAITEAISGLKQVRTEAKQASKNIDGLTDKFDEQKKELTALKKKYVDVADAQGKESKAAKDLADKIKNLSKECVDNKKKMDDLSKSANSFDATMNTDASGNIDGTTNSVNDLKGALQAIIGLKFGDMMLDMFSDELKEKIKTIRKELSKATAESEEAWGYIGRMFSSFNKNSKIYTEEGEVWGGLKGAFKGATEEAKNAASSGAKVWKHNLKAVGEAGKVAGGTAIKGIKAIATTALGAIAASVAIVAGAVVAMVVAFKNALTVAKQINSELQTAAKAGMSVQEYGELAYVLKSVGIEADKAKDFTAKMTEKQIELRDGSEDVAEAFRAIGISQEEALGSDKATLFKKTVEGLQGIENATERAAIAQKLFSDDAKELSNLLYLNNKETQSLIANYYNLGAAPSENLTKQSQKMAQATQNLSYAWEGFKNVLAEWVLPACTWVVQALTNVIAVLNVLLGGVFQIKSATQTDYSEAGNSIKESFDDATKSAKELQRYTMGFDELNIVGKQDSSSSSGNTSTDYGSGGAGFDMDMPVIKTPDLSGLRKAMDEYGSIIQGFLTWIGVLGGIALIVAGCCTGTIPLILAGAAVLGLGIAVGAAGGEESHWAKLGEGISNAFKSAVAGIKWFITALVEGLGNALGWCYDNFLAPLGKALASAWNAICKVFAPIGNWFGKLFQSLWETWKSWWSMLAGLALGCWDAICIVWNVCSDWFYNNVITPVGNFFAKMWEGISNVASKAWEGLCNGASKAWEGIKTVFTPMINWFGDMFAKAWDNVKKVFSIGGKIFEGIKEGISKVFTTVVNGLIKGINTVIAAPFKAINGVLNTVRGISIAGIKPFEKYIKYNHLSIPEIPQLAHGGIATGDTLAHIGEQGYKEAVLPLDRNTEWMDVLADRIANRSNTPSRIVLNVDGRELGYATINSINGITRQTGELGLIFA